MKPEWLKVPIPDAESISNIRSKIQGSTHTICEEARCPNLGECWKNGTATFLILGDRCTRNCRYCNVRSGTPEEPDEKEPERLANIIKELGLRYSVITSVTRDDLEDGGADHFRKTIRAIRKLTGSKIEVLTPDFKGDMTAIRKVLGENPEVFAHNIEAVERLFPRIRPEADYKKSMAFLKTLKQLNPRQTTKSGLMIGLGETKKEIIKTMRTLRLVKVDLLTIGQYLQPRTDLAKVERYYTPEEFEEFKNIAYDLGFEHVESAPLVRSSYHAEEAIR